MISCFVYRYDYISEFRATKHQHRLGLTLGSNAERNHRRVFYEGREY